MVICIASGKEGTGKTTIATNLGVSLNGNVQLLDCDVEEPNAHLFMKPEFKHTVRVTTPTRCRLFTAVCELVRLWLRPSLTGLKNASILRRLPLSTPPGDILPGHCSPEGF